MIGELVDIPSAAVSFGAPACERRPEVGAPSP